MKDATTGSSLTDAGDEDARAMGVSCFNLNLLLEGNNFYSKVGEAGFILSKLGTLPTL